MPKIPSLLFIRLRVLPREVPLALLARSLLSTFLWSPIPAMSSSPPTQKDLDCIFLARDALFPLKIQRDGCSHPTQFPASEATGKVRDAAMEHDANRPASSFFPRGIVVVHDVNNQSTLQWNGQPDIAKATASVPVIPQLLSVRCRVCGDGREAYIERKATDKPEREIVLCSDKLLKGDYTPSKIPDKAPQSLVAVETALAHHVTKVGLQVERERKHEAAAVRNTDTTTTCADLAAMEVLAARAAECYYSQTKGIWGQKAAEVKRGPALGHAGFSWYPESFRNMLQDRCVRAVATRATALECNAVQAKKCVAAAMDKK